MIIRHDHKDMASSYVIPLKGKSFYTEKVTYLPKQNKSSLVETSVLPPARTWLETAGGHSAGILSGLTWSGVPGELGWSNDPLWQPHPCAILTP